MTTRAHHRRLALPVLVALGLAAGLWTGGPDPCPWIGQVLAAARIGDWIRAGVQLLVAYAIPAAIALACMRAGRCGGRWHGAKR